MNRDDIIDLADKAGFEICRGDGWPDKRLIQKLMRFAALAVAAEREECAKACEETTASWTQHLYNEGVMDCVKAIRARGEK